MTSRSGPGECGQKSTSTGTDHWRNKRREYASDARRGYRFWVQEGADAQAERDMHSIVDRLVTYLESLQRPTTPRAERRRFYRLLVVFDSIPWFSRCAVSKLGSGS